MGRHYRLRQEEVVAIKVVIHAAGDLGSLGSKRGASTFKKYHDHDAAKISVGVAGEPSKASSGTRTGAGLS